MKPRLLIACWLGLLVPTLVAGGLLYRLLRNEQARLAETRRSAAVDRGRALAEQIALTLADIKQQMLAGLEDIDAGQLPAWRDRHPLARNVFAWREGQGLLVPAAANGLTEEESRFAQRYEPLFSGRQPWRPHAPPDQQPQAAQQRYSPAQEIRGLNVRSKKDLAQSWAPAAAVETGWIPWFAGDGLFFLGWSCVAGSGLYKGVELETAAVISRLVSALPAQAPPGSAYAILDGNGQVVFQRGAREIEAKAPATASIPIGSELPHWSIAVYADGSAGAPGGRAFAALALLTAGAFVAAIGASGTLLLWQARRNLLDARRKTTFVSNVSHELKTPLTTLRMYAEMLGEGRVRDEGRRKEYLDTMVRESQRLTRLVNNVLDFSRLEQGRKTYRMETLDLVEAVRDALGTQFERLSAAGMDLTIEGDGGCAVQADRDAVGQIALNLADNAIKYAAAGKRLVVRFGQAGGRCTASFVDAGPGVPAAHRERIFEQFHRVDESLTSGIPGCGLGLSIARRLARDHCGDLTYQPAPGGGCVFTLSLPAVEGQETGVRRQGSVKCRGEDRSLDP
jgi:signal transduction histidine kinase